MSNWKSREKKVGKRKAYTFKSNQKTNPQQKKVKTSMGRKI